MTASYDVHWNDHGRFSSFVVTVSGADKSELCSALWAEIRKKVPDANLVTGIWKLNY